MTSAHDGDATMESTGLTRRQVLKVGAATFVGYAVAVDKVEAQAIKTDTTGIVAGDYTVKIGDYSMPVYEARPASGRQRSDRPGDLGGLGRPRVGQGRDAPVRQGRLLLRGARALPARGRGRPSAPTSRTS